jgi:MOSC domain-containing protein YiiM
MSKQAEPFIRLLEGLGVQGDAHAGEKVQHLYHIRKNPDAPNRCQVHLIQAELHDELRAAGFDLTPGQMGENVTTRDVDLLGLPTGTRLRLGEAVVELTGLRTPCRKLDGIQRGLMAATRGKVGRTVCFKAGIMAIVVEGGIIKPGDAIQVELPPEPHRPVQPL